MAGLSPFSKSLRDAALSQVLLAGEACGVDPQQYVDAVPGPLGYLGGGNAAVEPGG